jgi:hypothetical protein
MLTQQEKINFWMITSIILFVILIAVSFYVLLPNLSHKLFKDQRLIEPTPVSSGKEIPSEKPTPQPTKVSPSVIQIQNYYPKPPSWRTVVVKNKGISICLPPKWEVADEYGNIIFNRDPGYKPSVAQINYYDYKGGSRREEYINLKVRYEYEPAKLKSETKVTELYINGRSVLRISIPSFPEALVFVMGNRLYAVELSFWNLVNDSQAAFNRDIYTMIGCAQPI